MNRSEATTSRLRSGDLVEVISGRDRGKRGRILRMLRKEGRAIVEGVQLVKKTQKATASGTPAGIITKEAAIHLSNLMIVDPAGDRPTRIGMRRVEEADGSLRWVRYARRSGQTLDNP